MYKPEECTEIMERTLGKPRNDFTKQEKKFLNCVIKDNLIGRYSMLIHYTSEQLSQFLYWVEEKGMDYFSLSDGERWAVEDVYTSMV